MKVFFDEDIPRKLARSLPQHEIHTVVSMEWGGIKDDALIARLKSPIEYAKFRQRSTKGKLCVTAIRPVKGLASCRCLVQNKTTVNDEFVLQDVSISGTRAPSSPTERDQYYRLMNEGYLRRVPVPPTPGDTNDPLVCELTERGRRRISGQR